MTAEPPRAASTSDGPIDRARENLTGIVSVLVTGIWLVALVTNQDWWLGALLLGYIVVVPVTALLFGDEDDVAEWWDDEDAAGAATGSKRSADNRRGSRRDASGDGTGDALKTLRERYARGELTDEQFERKLERLLETETLEDAADRSDTTGTGEREEIEATDREEIETTERRKS
ncbi:Short C-terminal domain-containing protein [Halopenitus malekzadehii]|uniref:Short C-terminal domain-containing protein n=1 Tax=Halopenitus malekzadehii TaxID=1267564 RepID=A0A1H6HNC9_9EURY|nr:SHOCT domain-containing protein [Halopenitus malekzadehii]SEH37319.1 Short C-terminal domain-containing protein [Halopenitus malekzadehii]